MTTFEKIIKYAATAFAAILAVGIVVGVLRLGFFIITSIAGHNIERTDITYTYNAEDIQSVCMDNSSANVTIEYYSGNEISVDATNVPVSFKCTTDSKGNLTIKNGTLKSAFLSFWGKNPKIVLLLPKDYELKNLKLNGDVGDITINDIKVETLDISGGVGDIDANGLSIDDFSFDGGVGDFNMVNCTINKSRINGGIGDIDIENSILKDIDIDNGIGDIDIEINGNIEDYSFDIDGGLGGININDRKPGYYKDNKGEYKISCDNGIGDIEITIE